MNVQVLEMVLDFNRTIVELKLASDVSSDATSDDFNRTIVELKQFDIRTV